jgi:hypothetical protein
MMLLLIQIYINMLYYLKIIQVLINMIRELFKQRFYIINESNNNLNYFRQSFFRY